MSIKVWWRMSWQDLRLSWDPADFNGVEETRPLLLIAHPWRSVVILTTLFVLLSLQGVLVARVLVED